MLSNSNIPSSIKWWKKSRRGNFKDSLQGENFNLQYHTVNFVMKKFEFLQFSRKKSILTFLPAIWCKIIFEESEFTIVKVEPSRFKMKKWIVDLFLRSYRQFFTIFGTVIFAISSLDKVLLIQFPCFFKLNDSWNLYRYYSLV